ncbi:MAG: hypothetical protein IKD99_04705 [Erysipelotrichaceae bacterium]|nr:hypothetical protein [Erysipelotrichaceae bacterium]MBQ1523000.1 hypothetical protein [Erysipelotrichaceae bacterium]MBR2745997.1 hypothetical protein [Erysipelotrichaceae bacterium]
MGSRIHNKSLSETQSQIKALLNRKVKVSYNSRGREVSDLGTITAVFNSLFIFEYQRNGQQFKASFTYTDVMTEVISVSEAE